MNLKLLVKVTRKGLDDVIAYHRECGYEVEVVDEGEQIVVMSSCPGYRDVTPLATGHFEFSSRRWKLWLNLRLPELGDI